MQCTVSSRSTSIVAWRLFSETLEPLSGSVQVRFVQVIARRRVVLAHVIGPGRDVVDRLHAVVVERAGVVRGPRQVRAREAEAHPPGRVVCFSISILPICLALWNVQLAFVAWPAVAVTLAVPVLPLNVQFVPFPDANAYPATFVSVTL